VTSTWSQRPCLAIPGSNPADRGISVHSVREQGEKAPRFKKKETFHIDMIEHAGHFTVEVITSLVSVSLCTMTHEI
jgi:hypothetical protein